MSLGLLVVSENANKQTDTYESDYCGHPFRVSGVFPSTYHQGSAQFISNIRWENMASGTELARDFCAGIGPLQLGVVLVSFFIIFLWASQNHQRTIVPSKISSAHDVT